MSYEEVTKGQNMGFQMFPTSTGPFPAYYYRGLRAGLGVLTKSNCPDKHEVKQKNHPPERLGRYMQIFTWLVILVEQHPRSFGVTKGYKLWLVHPRTPSGLRVL